MRISKACFSHPLKIGIDCRMYGLKHAGIGRYVENLVGELLKIDSANEYVIFVQKDFLTQNSKPKVAFNASKTKNQKASSEEFLRNIKLKTIIADIPHYSLKEQLLMPGIVAKEKVDLMHFPHFNVPVFFSGRYIVTIHDLIKHTSRGAETTTRSPWLYWLKYFGYKIVFWLAVKRATKIIAPSQFVKDEVVREYGVKPGKVVVTYEGVDNKLKVPSRRDSLERASEKLKVDMVLEKYRIKKPFLLYVGSVYPHKNVEKLIEAIKLVNEHITSHISHITLVIVCARNVFSERLRNKVVQMEAEEFINQTGFVPDEDLMILYQEAIAFVFPTLSEGFGLPGLEAISVGCPVVCSDIPVLREIYGEAAVYFDPLDSRDIAEKILEIMDQEDKRDKLIKEGENQIKKYSWEKTAKETLSVYKSVLE